MVTQLAAARRAAPLTAVTGIVLALALGVGGGVLRFVNTEPALRTVELAGDVAFAVVLAAPALLAILGLRGRPSLLVAAGALELVFAFLLLISLVGLVLVVPAVLFLVGAGQLRGGGTSRPRAVAAVLVAVVLGTGAFFALFAHEDPACWASNPATGETYRLDPSGRADGGSIRIDSRGLPPGATEAGCSSDTVSTAEALAAIGIVAVMLGVAWGLAPTPTWQDEPGDPPVVDR